MMATERLGECVEGRALRITQEEWVSIRAAVRVGCDMCLGLARLSGRFCSFHEGFLADDASVARWIAVRRDAGAIKRREGGGAAS